MPGWTEASIREANCSLIEALELDSGEFLDELVSEHPNSSRINKR